MINKERYHALLESYKAGFEKRMKNERFKWQSIKSFQDKWDIDSPDFVKMLSEALNDTSGLLASKNYFPVGMIVGFAKSDPERVRAMFRNLFDESKDLYDRIYMFKTESDELLAKHGGDAKQHYQYENAITTYLWLRYPDKYYIYKYSEVKAVSAELESDYVFKKGAYENNINNFMLMYDEINAENRKDEALIEMMKAQLSKDCYSDPELKTLTIDFGFYLSRYYPAELKYEWFPKNYSPELTAEDWITIISDKSVFTNNALTVMKCMKDYGGQATCTQLSKKYGRTKNFYNNISSTLAENIVKEGYCDAPPLREGGNSRWWPVLYVGRNARKEEIGSYVWKLRDELSEALDRIDLSDIELYEKDERVEDAGEAPLNYWWLTANPKIWSFTGTEVGEAQSYTLYNSNGNKRRIFQNFLDAKAGDPVIVYEANPTKKIVGIARITKENDGTAIFFEKVEGLASYIDYQTIKDTPELENMEFLKQLNGSLFRLTKDEYDVIMDMIREENPVAEADTKLKAYTKDDFLGQVYMSEDDFESLKELLINKKNIILKGAPGVGKTFTAKRLAYAMMGEMDDSRIDMVQFHQNYSYEDFVMGYRPDGNGFKLTEGIFYRFCQNAANNPDKDYFFIIDEINRGNLSKIFGELLMLIEKGYRGTKLTMAYNGMKFYVPENLYIIAMMNTADRSIALIDYALRRRFGFFDMAPGFNSDGFRRYQKELGNETFDALIDTIKDLNRAIANDKSLGTGFQIGHSYFCGREELGCSDSWMRSVIEYDIIPMLGEYWFDNPNELQRWERNLRGVLND